MFIHVFLFYSIFTVVLGKNLRNLHIAIYDIWQYMNCLVKWKVLCFILIQTLEIIWKFIIITTTTPILIIKIYPRKLCNFLTIKKKKNVWCTRKQTTFCCCCSCCYNLCMWTYVVVLFFETNLRLSSNSFNLKYGFLEYDGPSLW